MMALGSDFDLEYLVAVATVHGKLCYGYDFNKYLYYIFMKCTHTGETHTHIVHKQSPPSVHQGKVSLGAQTSQLESFFQKISK